MTKLKRCAWVVGKPDYYLDYHDHTWGKPEHDETALYKWLILETFHVGLSWQLILAKLQHFERALDQFDYRRIAQYSAQKIDQLATDASIIRHRGKISAAVTNAQAFQAVQQEAGSFDAYIWHFTEGKTIENRDDCFVTRNALSDTVTKDLKKRGFKFIGSVTVYSYLQAIGVINDHELDCAFRHT